MNLVQRFGSSLALNVHFHALFLCSTYVVRGPAGRPTFHPAPPIKHVELARVPRDIVRRIERVLRDRGILDNDASSEGGGSDESGG